MMDLWQYTPLNAKMGGFSFTCSQDSGGHGVLSCDFHTNEKIEIATKCDPSSIHHSFSQPCKSVHTEETKKALSEYFPKYEATPLTKQKFASHGCRAKEKQQVVCPC